MIISFVKESVKNKIQKRVGILSSLLLIIVILVNTINLQFNDKYGYSFFGAITNPAVLPFLIFVIPFLLSIFFYSDIFKLLQVITLFIFAIISFLIVDNGYLIGPLFFIFALMLSMQYGFLHRHFLLKITIIIIVFFSIINILKIFFFDPSFANALLDLSVTLVFTILYYIIFAEDLKDKSNDNKKLREEKARDQVFVIFGRNVSGVIHNIKSSLMSVYGFTDLIEKDPSNPEYLKLLKQSIGTLDEITKSLLFSVKACQSRDVVKISVLATTKSVIELFKANLLYKKNLRIDISGIQENHTIKTLPMELIQILQNLITNSMEAIEDQLCVIKMSSEETEKGLELYYQDNGNGIPWITQGKIINCLKKSVFSLGKTTKESGEGIGMIYVTDIFIKLKGEFYVYSTPSGTCFTMLFPH